MENGQKFSGRAVFHPGEDGRLPDVVTHSRPETSFGSILGGGPGQPGSGSLSTGSPAGRALQQLKAEETAQCTVRPT